MKPEYFSNKDVVKPSSPDWIKLGVKLFGHGSISCYNTDVVYKNEYVKVVGGKIIAKNVELNTAPIVNHYDEVLKDGYYYGDVYEKECDYRFFTHGTYKGVRCEVLHHQDFDFGKHSRVGDCVIRLEGATRNKNVRVSEIVFPPLFYAFHSQLLMKEDNAYVPSFTSLEGSRWSDVVSFEVEHDRNNENLGRVSVSPSVFASRYFLFSNSPATPEFARWIGAQTQQVIMPILYSNSNWDEHQEYDPYEGYRLGSISLKIQAISALNAAVYQMFTNYKGVKYSIEKF